MATKATPSATATKKVATKKPVAKAATKSKKDVAKSASLAPIISALQSIYLEIAKRVLQKDGTVLPEAIITVARDSKKLGHFTLWTPWNTIGGKRVEILITGECLARGEVQVLTTLLHEAAHAYNFALKRQDVSGSQYHNKHFRNVADSMFGLIVKKHPTRGWAITEAAADINDVWGAELLTLKNALEASAVEAPAKQKKQADRNLVKCVCDCDTVVRMSPKVLEMGTVKCSACKKAFQEA
jgi:hypothetical protein